MVRGSHQIGIGVNWISPVHHSLLNGASGGTFNFNGTVTGLPQADFLVGRLASFAQGNTQFNSARHQYVGLYAQDSWRLNPRLKVNYGLRWEPFIGGKSHVWPVHLISIRDSSIKTCIPPSFPNAPAGMLYIGEPDLTQVAGRTISVEQFFAPRVGTVGILKRRQTTVRASWGMFYDLPHTLFFDDTRGEPPWGQNITVYEPPEWFC